jgi:hypothetical protein
MGRPTCRAERVSRLSTIGSGAALAAAYAAAVFGAGFLLGAIRIVFVVPRLGARAAELVELPLMLAVSFFAAGWVSRRLGPDAPIGRRFWIGVVALLLLLGAEALTGMALRGVSAHDALINPDPVSGPLYYVSLVLVAVLPALRRARRSTPGTA